MRNAPSRDMDQIFSCFATHYNIRLEDVTLVHVGFDTEAAAFQGRASGGQEFFIKILPRPMEAALHVQRLLADSGVPNIMAPVLTTESRPWCFLAGDHGDAVTAYPFVHGGSAMVSGMSPDQWREFGASMRAVHNVCVGEQFRHDLRAEDFALPSSALVRQLLALPDHQIVKSRAAAAYARFLSDHTEGILRILDRAEALGRSLQTRSWKRVLCHGDIHAANIMVATDGRIWLVDWDAPLLAPQERDLLFVIGSRIAREVTPAEEEFFLEGYGPIDIDPEALIYYRYERIIEDIGEFAKTILLNPWLSEADREKQATIVQSLFEVDGDIERAESVARHQWPAREASGGLQEG
jgi:spectinomycin phosphotransferase